MLRIRLFGHLALAADDMPLPPSGRREVDRLLAYLLLTRDDPGYRDRVAIVLWPNAGREAALDKLRPTLSHLQAYLRAHAGLPEGGAWLLSDRSSVAWNPAAPCWLDVDAFEDGAAVLDGAGDPPVETAIEALRAALAVYTGPLLREFGDPWAVEASDRCEALATRLQTELARLLEQAGQRQAAVEVARQLVARDTLSEDSHALLIGLLARSGDRSGALAQLDACRASLDQAFGVAPSAETRALVADLGALPRLSTDSFAGEEAGARRRSTEIATPLMRLPATAAPNHATPLVDFRRVDRIRQLLAAARLLTLTGPPGCGKSRLAAAAVAEHAAATAGELWWVDVAAPGADTALRAILARAGGPAPTTGDAAAPVVVPALVVLDNADAAAACAELAAVLLSNDPRARILATGREPLFVDGEVVWSVPLLDTAPEADARKLARPSEAATLFLDRAARWGRVGQPAGADLAAIEAICRRLDGLPLAIEVAAAWTAEREPSAILRSLDDGAWLARTCPDAASRFTTLADALEGSTVRLDDSARALFRRLAVLDPPFSLEQAEAVGAGDLGGGDVPVDRVLDLLAQLVDASLVVADVNSMAPCRHRLLQVVRQFAWIELTGAGELAAAEQRLQHPVTGTSPEPGHLGT
jgi:predicted ATPase/DNA-binding SARP family transcriptional activator